MNKLFTTGVAALTGLSELRALGFGELRWGDEHEFAYPADYEPLASGSTYYWKVNRIVGEDAVPAPYVGFRVPGPRRSGGP